MTMSVALWLVVAAFALTLPWGGPPNEGLATA